MSPASEMCAGVADSSRKPAANSDPHGEPHWDVDRRLVALCRERGALRSVLARIGARLVFERAWERIGYARLSDYAPECLGLSGRSVRSLAEVGERLRELPGLEQALVSGTLGWTKVRLLARLPREEDAERWIDLARRVTAEALSREVRAVDRGSIETGAAQAADGKGRLFEVRCTPEVRWKWLAARGGAARAAGRVLHVSEAAELIAAEVLSALPIEETAHRQACEEAGISWRQETDSSGDASSGDTPSVAALSVCALSVEASSGGASSGASSEDGAVQARDAISADTAVATWRANRTEREPADPAHPVRRLMRPSLPAELETLLEELEDQDAFELHARLKNALLLAQGLDARIGALLAFAWGRFLHRALGYASREAYARERLGMDPTRARALVRLERAAQASMPFARACRTGVLSWVKAELLVPLLHADPLGRFVGDWVVWAGRMTVRRLREDVEHAMALAETDAKAFHRNGGLPTEAQAEAHGDREIGAAARGLRQHYRSGSNVSREERPRRGLLGALHRSFRHRPALPRGSVHRPATNRARNRTASHAGSGPRRDARPCTLELGRPRREGRRAPPCVAHPTGCAGSWGSARA